MSLFKYYSPKKYNFAAIAQHQLFFCRPSGLNDPYDTTTVNINAFPGFCDKLNIKDPIFRKSLDEHVICCFSKGDKPDNRHLWAFYASNYEGFSVEYDENALRNPIPSMIVHFLCLMLITESARLIWMEMTHLLFMRHLILSTKSHLRKVL